jgi:LPXTG-site transpeptidase (sortase) family protein
VSASPAAIRVPATRRARPARPPRALVIGALSIVALLVVAYIGSNVWASIGQRGLERRFDAAAARWSTLDPVARSSLAYAHGDPIARLEIPSIGLDTIVVEGATPALMRKGPGHLPASATPGENGVAIITANRFGFGSFFLRIDRLSKGDRITAYSALGTTTYQVDSVRRVSEDSMDLAVESAERVLVLFGSSRLWGGADRIVVRALALEEGTA